MIKSFNKLLYVPMALFILTVILVITGVSVGGLGGIAFIFLGFIFFMAMFLSAVVIFFLNRSDTKYRWWINLLVFILTIIISFIAISLIIGGGSW